MLHYSHGTDVINLSFTIQKLLLAEIKLFAKERAKAASRELGDLPLNDVTRRVLVLRGEIKCIHPTKTKQTLFVVVEKSSLRERA